MRKITGSKLLAIVTTAIFFATVFWLAVPQSSAGTVPLDQLTTSLVEREAAKYRRAVSDLGAIGTMSLKTEADFKRASSIINDQTENLRFIRYRMVQIALSNSVFVAAVNRELGRARGNQDAVLRSYRQNPAALTSLNGAQSTQQRIRTELAADSQKLKRAGEHLQSSASSILNRRADAPAREVNEAIYVKAGYYVPSAVDNFFEALFAATTVIAGARSTRTKSVTKAPGSPDGGSSGGSGGGSSWAQDEEEYRECATQAAQKRDRCKSNCGPGLFQWACLGNCDASYLLTKVSCAVNSMYQY